MNQDHAARLNVWVALALLHIPLALLFQQAAWLATLAALLTALVGAALALDPRRARQAALLAAYIVSADILWRITHAGIPLHYCKYTLALICFLGAVVRRPGGKVPVGLAYFALLLPAAWLTLLDAPPGTALAQLDFNLSGPLALAPAWWFFSGLRIDRGMAQELSLALLTPLVGVLALIAAELLQAPSIVFRTTDANQQITLGFPPNELAMALGLAALICFLYLLILRPGRGVRVFTATLLPLFLGLSALTLSRGGLYLFVAGALTALLFSLRAPGTRRAALVILALLAAAAILIAPALAFITHGAIFARFGDLDSSGRAEAAQTEIALFLTHPILGVGPGMGDTPRGVASQAYNQILRSHNELTRMPAEHGLPGLLALALLLHAGWKGLHRPAAGGAQAWAAALTVWVFAGFVYTAFRLAMPALLLGVCLARLDFSPEAESQPTLPFTAPVKFSPAQTSPEGPIHR